MDYKAAVLTLEHVLSANAHHVHGGERHLFWPHLEFQLESRPCPTEKLGTHVSVPVLAMKFVIPKDYEDLAEEKGNLSWVLQTHGILVPENITTIYAIPMTYDSQKLQTELWRIPLEEVTFVPASGYRSDAFREERKDTLTEKLKQALASLAPSPVIPAGTSTETGHPEPERRGRK